MSSYWGGVWNDLKFNAGSAAVQTVSGVNIRIRQNKSPLTYKNPRYKSVVVHVAKRLVMSSLEGELHKLLPKFRKYIDEKERKIVLKQQQENVEKLINNREIINENYGSITTENGNRLQATDAFGYAVPEALMLYLTDEIEHNYTFFTHVGSGQASINPKKLFDSHTTVSIDNRIVTNEVSTKTLCHIDLSPQISTSSNKNIVMTQVQGRDFTRKELVSGGDLTFSISGNIVSDQDGVYPTTAVKRFLKLMQYNGILNVNSFAFGPLGITRVIVTEWSLGAVQFKNMQPYSFSCVAVEPDEEIKIEKDTIQQLNRNLELSPMDEWYKSILDNKLAEMGATSLVNTASGLVSQGTGLGLDALVPNV